MSTVLLAAATGLFASVARVEGFLAFLLTCYLLVFAGTVVVLAALSPPHLVTRGWVLGGTVVLVAMALLTWLLAGRPQPPSPRASLQISVKAFADPVLLFLGLVVLVGFAYLAALAVGTPPNSWDAMWVHLARAAFWKQQHSVGYLEDAKGFVVLNVYPPVPSMAALFSMVLASQDRYVSLVSLSAYVAIVLAVIGVGRRLAFDPRSALFGGLLFATLPVVVLQASGALNDLVVASFLMTCIFFSLGERKTHLGLSGLAFALAVGAKMTAILFSPLIVLVLLAARPTYRLAWLATGVLAGLVGSIWYFLNRFQTGSFGGRLDESYGLQNHHYDFAGSAARILRLLLDFVEVPGAAGLWGVSFVGAAAAVSLLALRTERVAATKTRLLFAAAALAVSPLFLIKLSPIGTRAYQWLFFHAGHPELGMLDQDRGITGASALASFFGPLGLVLVFGVAAAVLVHLQAGRQQRLGLALAVTPFLAIFIVAIVLSYSPYWGRLFMFPMALAAAASGVFLRTRGVAWGLTAIAAATMLLTLRANDEKPPELWGKPRWRVQTQVGGSHNGELSAIRFAATSIPSKAHVALVIRGVDWSYPFFGRRLTRTVRIFDSDRNLPREFRWLVVAPSKMEQSKAWVRVLRTNDGWQVFRRDDHARRQRQTTYAETSRGVNLGK